MAKTIIRRDILAGAATLVAACAIPFRGSVGAAPKIHDVTIKSFEFEPGHLVVRSGDTIRWTNADLAPHTATARDMGWDTGEIGKGDTGSIVAFEGMETNYFCAFHPHMKGTIELI